MAGGNSHQRAVQKAANKRIEKQVSASVANYFSEHPATLQPIEQRSLLRKLFDWEGISFVTLSLTGIAFLTVQHGWMICRMCFTSAATVLVIKVVLNLQAALYPQIIITVLDSIVDGVAVTHIST